jgi:glyoxylase-like metal-dependent hydrolase (beta-lactamase superfamily II)
MGRRDGDRRSEGLSGLVRCRWDQAKVVKEVPIVDRSVRPIPRDRSQSAPAVSCNAIVNEVKVSYELKLSATRVQRIADIERVSWPIRALFQDAEATQLESQAARFPNAVASDPTALNLSFSSFLVRTPDVCCLIDCGVGNDKSRLDRPPWHERKGDFLAQLRSCGVGPSDIEIVINTHLHADHVGWNTVLESGTWVPTFPNARYVVSKTEMDFWRGRYQSDSHILHGAFDDSVQPVLERNLFSTVDLPCEIAPNLWLEAAPGHTGGQSTVRLLTPAGNVVFLADVMHTPLQFALPHLSSRFCADYDQAVKTRTALLDTCAGNGSIVAAYHFPSPIFGRVAKAGSAYDFRPVAVA